MRRSFAATKRLSACLLAGSCALAQTPAVPPAKDSGALVVQTADHDVARLFVAPVDMPELPERPGAHWKITLLSDGKFVAEAGEGVDKRLVVRAKVHEIAKLLRADLERAAAALDRDALATTLQVERADLDPALDAWFALPFEVQSLSIDALGKDDDPKYSATAELVAVPGSRLGSYLASLAQAPRAVPDLTATGDLLSLRIDLPAAAFAPVLRAAVATVVGNAGRLPAARDVHRRTLATAFALCDGRGALAIGAGARDLRALAGVHDAARMQTLFASDEWRAWRRADAEADPVSEVDLDADAEPRRHRDVELSRRVRRDDLHHTESWSALAGDCLLLADSEATLLGLVNRCLDRQPAPTRLRDGAVVWLSTRLSDLALAFTDGNADVSDVPEQVEAALRVDASAVFLQLTVTR